MKNIFKVSLMLLVIFLLSGCSNKYLKEISYNEYNKLIENKESFILEVMSAECSACKNFKPKLEEVTKIAATVPQGRNQAVYYRDEVASAMVALRTPVDKLEMLVDKAMWPMPSYGDLIFEV